MQAAEERGYERGFEKDLLLAVPPVCLML